MKQHLLALHLLPHQPPSQRAAWVTQTLGDAEGAADELLHALRQAYPQAKVDWSVLQALVEGDLAQIEAATMALRQLHASRAEPHDRPLPGRGCRFCQAACQYGQVMTVSLTDEEERAARFLDQAPGSPAQRLLPLATLLVNGALGPHRLSFDLRMTADMAYCLATQMAGMRVGAQRLATLEVLQQQLDLVRR